MSRWAPTLLGVGLSLILAALIASPAGATVQFTKQWVGGSEFGFASYVATDPSGDVYVSDVGFNSRVLKLDSSGALIATLGGPSPGSDPGQFNSPTGVATDSSGNLYVAEGLGHRVQKFDAAGNFVLMWGEGVNNTTGGDICTAASGDTCQSGTLASTGGGFNGLTGIATDSSDNVYVAEFTNRRVQKFDSSGNFQRAWGFGVASGAPAFETCTVAATCQAGISGSGDGQFNAPHGIATDSLNNVYVADSGNDRIQKFDSSGSFTTKWGTSGAGPGQFNDLQGLGSDSSDNLYALDFTNNNVQVFSSGGTFIRSFGKAVNHTTGGDACTAASGDTCGAGTSGSADGQFLGADGVTVDASGNVYVGDANNSRVQKFDSSGAFVWKVGNAGSGGAFDTGINYLDIASDATGNLYTSDHDTSRIQKFNPLGRSLNAWGTAGTGGGQVGGPTGTAVDSAGNVYVAERENNRVTKYDSNGSFVLTWGKGVNQSTPGDVCTAVSGDTCQAGTQGSADGQLDGPNGLTVDASGNVYVADTGNDRVQKFDPSGTFLTKWGSHGAGNGQFDAPMDVATDSLGEVYVADRDNNRIQRFTPIGGFLGKWGTAGPGSGEFQQPIAVTADSQRNVYVVDYTNARIQVFRPTGVFVEQWGSVGAGDGQFNGPSSIALGSGARIYVADAGNNRVQMFTESDTSAPQTALATGPSGTTNDPTPTFSFSSSEPAGALFECRIDGSTQDDFKPCGSTHTLAHLGDGSHTFDVRAIDSAGNVDSTAASRAFMVKTAAVSVSGSTLVVTAAAGAKDNLRVTRPSASIVRVTDAPGGTYTGSGVHTGAGCTRVGDYRADCTAAGVTLVRIATGGSIDQVRNSTTMPSSLNGGPADDILVGGTGADTLVGGTGADRMKGMNGNDRLLAHDLANDTSVNCDGGTHPGSADRADLDLLPKDSAVFGCERMTRH